MSSTITKKKQRMVSNKHFEKAAVLASIREWRNTSGRKLNRWNEVKTIRLLRERGKMAFMRVLDASYVALGKHLRCPLVTADAKLYRNASIVADVRLL